MTFSRGWRGALTAGALGVVCLAASGCRHKQVTATVPIPPPKLLPVDTTARSENTPVIQPVPIPPVPLTSVKVPVKKVKKPRRQVAVQVPPAVVPPVQVAVAAPAAEAAVGALTPGGSDAPQQHREAQDLISSLERRLAGLPQSWKDQQKSQLLQVRSFQREAQTALKAGDTEGAVTLATKANLLLDDLMK